MGRAVSDGSDRDRWTLSIGRFRQIALVTAVGLCLLVVAGGVVRLTGSGLGCDDWPNCNDQSFVDVSSGHTAIEQVNRLLSGLIGIPTLAMAIGSFRVRPARPRRGPTGLVVPSTACWRRCSPTGWSVESPCAATFTPRSSNRISCWR